MRKSAPFAKPAADWAPSTLAVAKYTHPASLARWCLGAIYWAHLDKIYYGNNKDDAADIGFDDSFIYEELALPRQNRKKAMEELLPEEAIAAFDLWRNTADKTEY